MDTYVYFGLVIIGMVIAFMFDLPDATPKLEPVVICAFTGPSALPCRHE